jgi:hypothetical protein
MDLRKLSRIADSSEYKRGMKEVQDEVILEAAKKFPELKNFLDAEDYSFVDRVWEDINLNGYYCSILKVNTDCEVAINKGEHHPDLYFIPVEEIDNPEEFEKREFKKGQYLYLDTDFGEVMEFDDFNEIVEYVAGKIKRLFDNDPEWLDDLM